MGGGIAGLSAAWLLHNIHNVTVYEQDNRLGGHSSTVDVGGPKGLIAVDTGFVVFNERTYPNLIELFRHIGVESRPSDMSFSVSLDDGRLEYGGSSLRALFAQGRNLFRRRFWQMIRDTLRFYREGPALLTEADAEHLSLGDYLLRERYSPGFIDDHLVPLAAAIWSTPHRSIQLYPAIAFIRFSMNHGLMQMTARPRWRTVVGGSRSYVARLAAPLAGRIRLGARVTAIKRLRTKVVVEDARNGCDSFDHVVIAAHADQALAMLADFSSEEQAILSAFKYTRNTAVLHSDPALMPRRRSVWSRWNYLAAPRVGSHSDLCITYWMNALQSLNRDVPLFVTLNPWLDPASASIHASFEYDHPAYDLAALAAQRSLAALQGANRTWFCGSYFGTGFHEDALSSGLDVAEAIGGVRRPWFQGSGDAARGNAVIAPSMGAQR